MNRLENKVAIITGAAQGVGLCAVKMFLDEGAKVVATDINGEKLFANIEALGRDDVIAVQHDVSSEEDWKNVVEKTLEKFGKLDVLVNNAGFILGKSVEVESLEEWNKIIGVSATGCFLGIKTCSAVMGTEGHSSIVNISSGAGLVGGPRTGNDAAYNTAKGGERLLTKHSAHALAYKNIRVNSIHPGSIMTDMLKMYIENDPNLLEWSKGFCPLAPYYSDPEDIVYGIIYLASDESKTVTGAELAIDNGLSSF
ncbi:MAG: SDR family oxidoreductase [Oscillospiraceae bacterium]|nr:SDR family oxidoreductase [Oscillospiraceae bacterium]